MRGPGRLTAESARIGRVGAPRRRGAPLTEPDLWATHPALRDAGVRVASYSDIGVSTRSYPSASASCAEATTPSSSPARRFPSCPPTSAPRSAQSVVGHAPLRRRPLSGCRLSRRTVRAVLPVGWPWPPSLPAQQQRLGPAFAGLPVLRGHPTPLVPSSSRSFVLDDYRLRLSAAEAERSPWVRTLSFVPTPTPLRTSVRQISGFAAARRLAHGPHASRRFACARFGTSPQTPSDLPSRARRPLGRRGPVLRPDALVLRC